MAPRKILTPAAQIAELTARVARLEGKQAALKEMPSEPFHAEGADTPVVWFIKTWGDENGAYQYVANHVTGKGWVISHQSKRTYMTWNDVLLFALMREPDGYVPLFYQAMEWKQLSAR